MYGAQNLQVYTGDILWEDGSSSTFPPILRARSGWWYKPEEAMTDKRKTFGMGRDGEKLAEEWHNQRFRQELIHHQGQLPVKLGTPTPTSDYHPHSDLLAHYQHPVYGQVTLSMQVAAPGYYQKNFNIAYQITYHQLIDRLMLPRELGLDRSDRLHKASNDAWAATSADHTVRREVEADKIETLLEKWKKSPWDATASYCGISDEVKKLLDPPEALTTPHYLPFTDTAQEVDGVTFLANVRIKRYMGQEVRKTLRDSMGMLNELGEVVKYWGVEFETITSYQGGEAQITGIKFVLPPSEDKPTHPAASHNEEGHTIKITEGGVVVTCGYVAHEQRYQQYEKEKAKKLLQEFDSYEPFEF